MRITLNGEEVNLAEPCTIERLLQDHPPRHRGFAVEVNHEVVPRKEHGSREVREGDRIEVVTLVGGG